ncbi:hypothetical protein GJ496_006209 [Pomphorhynchus laevis]|nr:hypothetical protein GJ496_006209 [Pomphorhynchus laevis]
MFSSTTSNSVGITEYRLDSDNYDQIPATMTTESTIQIMENKHIYQPPVEGRGQQMSNLTNMRSEGATELEISFLEVSKWKPNLSSLPQCNESRIFLRKLTNLFNKVDTPEDVAGSALMSVSLLSQCVLQRLPTRKIALIRKTMARRLRLWSLGNLKELLEEARSLQRSVKLTRYIENKSWKLVFIKQMSIGKTSRAMRMLDPDFISLKVLCFDDNIENASVRDLLDEKHSASAGLVDDAIFCEDGIELLGSFIGSVDYVRERVISRVSKWSVMLERLVEIALFDPQCALSAYTFAFQHSWTHLYIPPELRKTISLPYGEGGLGLDIIGKYIGIQYDRSCRVSAALGCYADINKVKEAQSMMLREIRSEVRKYGENKRATLELKMESVQKLLLELLNINIAGMYIVKTRWAKSLCSSCKLLSCALLILISVINAYSLDFAYQWILYKDSIGDNLQYVKHHSNSESYCDPPNPCPYKHIGFDCDPAPFSKFTALYSANYQHRQQNCKCDSLHDLLCEGQTVL